MQNFDAIDLLQLKPVMYMPCSDNSVHYSKEFKYSSDFKSDKIVILKEHFYI